MTASHSNRWLLLVTVAAGLLLITLDNSVLYTALPTLTRELGATSTQGLWIINAYPLVMAGLLLGAGTLGDRIGHRTMFLAGLVLFGLASIVAAFSPTPEVLIAARAFLAVGASAMMPATLALIRVTFTVERERNVAIAIWGSISIVGAAIGPIIGGLLLEHFWWGSVFLINVPVVIVAFIGTLLVAPKVAGDLSRPWDLLSSVQALATLSALVIAIKEAASADPSPAVLSAAMLVTVAAGFLFVRRQARLPFPLLDFAIFRNPAFSSGVLAAAMMMFALGGIQLVTTQRFQLVAGYSPLEAGLLVSAAAIGSLPTALLGGALLHRIGLRYLISGGLGAGSLAVLLTAWGLGQGTGWVLAGMFLTGAGLGAAASVASTAIIGNAPVHRAGMAASIEEVSYEFGGLLAVAILGSLLSALYTLGIVLPEGAPVEARDNIATALTLAAGDTANGPALAAAASAAFDNAYLVVMYVGAALLAAGAILTGVLLRHYGPGSQSSLYPSH
ncbi:TPA: MFS transporter [Enterobacter asburiae]|nr:MFS transporter [Enterobacter asburiae]